MFGFWIGKESGAFLKKSAQKTFYRGAGGAPPAADNSSRRSHLLGANINRHWRQPTGLPKSCQRIKPAVRREPPPPSAKKFFAPLF
jgi:hypothetical protein